MASTVGFCRELRRFIRRRRAVPRRVSDGRCEIKRGRRGIVDLSAVERAVWGLLLQAFGESATCVDVEMISAFVKEGEPFAFAFVRRILSEPEFAAMVARDEDLAPCLTHLAGLVILKKAAGDEGRVAIGGSVSNV